MVDLAIWLVGGGVIGWLASAIMHPDDEQDVALNVALGIAGASLGGGLVSPLLGMGAIHPEIFNTGALLVSLVGAILLLAIVNVFRQGSAP